MSKSSDGGAPANSCRRGTTNHHSHTSWRIVGLAVHLVPVFLASLLIVRGLVRLASVDSAPEPNLVAREPATTADNPESESTDELGIAVADVATEETELLPRPVELETLPPPLLAKAAEAIPAIMQPVKVGPNPPAPIKAILVRRNKATENELFNELMVSPEFGLTLAARQALPQAYAEDYQTKTEMSLHGEFDPSILLRHFPAARQLPLRPAPICQLIPNAAANLGILSKKLHAYLDRIAPKNLQGKRDPMFLRDVLKRERRGKRPEWLRSEAVPAMVQILMAEDTLVRLLLVDLLSEIEGKAASERLAQRAVFDLSPEVRQAAVYALRDRPRPEFRDILVNALRYPWPAAADHAAEALVALEDRDAAPLLIAQLGKPDPAAPFPTRNNYVAVREVVAINHVANCLLCHVPAVNGKDLVIGVDPITQRPPPSLERRYGRTSNGQGIWAGKVLIRADVQFLRQDFSVTFPMHRLFGDLQGLRFDYAVRTRVLKGAELGEWRKHPRPASSDYPQREAVLHALRALTGKDLGPATDAWVKFYPHADAQAEGVRLSAALLRAPPESREVMLARYRDAKEESYTGGLARAIPLLKGRLQGKVREALVLRLTRLPAGLLRDRLQDENDELRHAAAHACARKPDKELTPELIGLLFHQDAEVAEGAHRMLRQIVGEDFGPDNPADLDQLLVAAVQWQEWWQTQIEP